MIKLVHGMHSFSEFRPPWAATAAIPARVVHGAHNSADSRPLKARHYRNLRKEVRLVHVVLVTAVAGAMRHANEIRQKPVVWTEFIRRPHETREIRPFGSLANGKSAKFMHATHHRQMR
jgi:hypothetical protein